jgi:hypothetical protein
MKRTVIPFEETLGTRVLLCRDRHCCLPMITETLKARIVLRPSAKTEYVPIMCRADFRILGGKDSR